jgi:hypothetical protein
MIKTQLKLDRNTKAKIRYQLLRDNGYTPTEARKLRHRAYVELEAVKEVKVSPTGEIVKNRKYQGVKGIIKADETINKLRKVENDTTYTRHGFLARDKRYKGQYNKLVSSIKKRDNLTTDQAYYFIWYMTETGYSYNETRRQLLGSKEFEKYDKRKKGKKPKKKRSKRGKRGKK